MLGLFFRGNAPPRLASQATPPPQGGETVSIE